MIRFACPNCGAHAKADDKAAGRRATCPRCKSRITIPSHNTTSDDAEREVYGSRPSVDDLAAALRSQREEPSGDDKAEKPARKLRADDSERRDEAPQIATKLGRMTGDQSPSPVLALVRSGLGFFLLVAFFLPWMEVSCNNTTVMHPSAFNLVTGIPDAKTRGTMRLGDAFDEEQPSTGKTGNKDFSYWDADVNEKARERDDLEWEDVEKLGELIRRLIARIALTLYGFLAMPAIAVLSGVLLYGHLRRPKMGDPPWEGKIQVVLGALSLAALALVLAYGLLYSPSEIPPPISIRLDWGFYLTVLTLTGLASVVWWIRRQPPEIAGSQPQNPA